MRVWASSGWADRELLQLGSGWSYLVRLELGVVDRATKRDKQLGTHARKQATAAPFASLELGSSSPEDKESRLSSSPPMVTGVSSDGGGKERERSREGGERSDSSGREKPSFGFSLFFFFFLKI